MPGAVRRGDLRPDRARVRAAAGLTLLLLSSLPAPAGPVVEPRTGVEFPMEAGGLTLAGVGVRTKLLVKVHATAFYIEPVAARRVLAGFRGRSREELSRDDAFFARLLGREIDQALTLAFVHDAGGDRVRNAFREGLEANLPALTPAAEQFLVLLAGDLGKRGDRLTVRTSPAGRILVLLNGQELGSLVDRPVATALWRVWFGPAPSFPRLRDALVARIPDLLLE